MQHDDRPEILLPVHLPGNRAAEGQACIDIRHDPAILAQCGEDRFFPSGPIGKRQDRLRMRVHDGRAGEEGVQQRLDRRHGGGGPEQARPELAGHHFVRDGGDFSQFLEIGVVETDKSRGGDRFHVRAGGLDEERGAIVAGERSDRTLERRVAAAVQGQFRPAPHDARHICQKRKLSSPFGAVGLYEIVRFRFNPVVFHGCCFFDTMSPPHRWKTVLTAS